MKNTKKFRLLLFANMVLALAVIGCRNEKTNSKTLTWKTVTDSIVLESVASDSSLGFVNTTRVIVDWPVSGPYPLTDSIRRALNKELYAFLDKDLGHPIPFWKVYTLECDNISAHYCDAYRRLYEQAGGEPGVFEEAVTISYVDETDAFVTYEIDCTHFGDWRHVTNGAVFRKKDGKRINEIITLDEFKRYFAESIYIPVWDPETINSFGLTEKGLLCYYQCGDRYIIEYDLILPYLSKEARNLVAKCKDCIIVNDSK